MFDDYRMRVAHERQKQSAEKWMGCKGAMDLNPDRRQYLKNSKRDEEVELSLFIKFKHLMFHLSINFRLKMSLMMMKMICTLSLSHLRKLPVLGIAVT